MRDAFSFRSTTPAEFGPATPRGRLCSQAPASSVVVAILASLLTFALAPAVQAQPCPVPGPEIGPWGGHALPLDGPLLSPALDVEGQGMASPRAGFRAGNRTGVCLHNRGEG